MPFGQTGNPSYFLPLTIQSFIQLAINVDKHRRESKKRQFTNLLGRVNMSTTGVTLYTADRNAFHSLPSLAGNSHSNSEHQLPYTYDIYYDDNIH